MFETFLKTAFEGAALPLSKEQSGAMAIYFEMLVERNKHVNLTAITDPEEAAVKHFADCAALFSAVRLAEGSALIDVGTGAGFPGLVIAMLRPDIRVTLLDSVRKRLDFLKDVISQIGISNASTVHSRAEDAARNSLLRENFDIAVARAVGNLSVISEYCLPFVRTGGMFVSYRGPSAREDVSFSREAIRKLGGGDVSVQRSCVPQLDHYFVIINKKTPTSGKYPRKAGEPSRCPIT